MAVSQGIEPTQKNCTRILHLMADQIIPEIEAMVAAQAGERPAGSAGVSPPSSNGGGWPVNRPGGGVRDSDQGSRALRWPRLASGEGP